MDTQITQCPIFEAWSIQNPWHAFVCEVGEQGQGLRDHQVGIGQGRGELCPFRVSEQVVYILVSVRPNHSGL